MGKENDHKADIVVAGHICLDLFPDFTDIPRSLQKIFVPGKLTEVSKMKFKPGGSVSNVSINLRKLGFKAFPIGRIGVDLLGKGLSDILAKEFNLPTDGLLVSPKESTSYSIMIEVPGYDKIALHNPGANNEFSAIDVPIKFFKDARHFHFGYPNLMKRMYSNQGEELVKMLSIVKGFNVTTSLDMAPIDENSESGKVDWFSILQKVLPLVDIFCPSLEELFYMLKVEQYKALTSQFPEKDMLEIIDLDEVTKLGDLLLELGAKTILIKCGEKGAYFRSGKVTGVGKIKSDDEVCWNDRELFKPSYSVGDPVASTGCGDCFIAGFLASFLQKSTPEECLKKANICGACHAGLGELPKTGFSKLEKMVSREWLPKELPLDQFHWTMNHDLNLYFGINDLFHKNYNLQSHE